MLMLDISVDLPGQFKGRYFICTGSRARVVKGDHVQAHRAMSARPGSQRRQEPSAQEVMQELDRFQQMLDLQQSRGIRSAVYF